MESQIRKALDSIVQSFEMDNLDYLKHLRNALENILNVMNQQYESMKETHLNQVHRLQLIIDDKQNQIDRLRAVSQYKQAKKKQLRAEQNKILSMLAHANINCNSNSNMNMNANGTPFKILLKGGKHNLNSTTNAISTSNKQNKQNIVKDLLMDQAFTNISISAMKQNRLSLQIVPGGLCKKGNRVTSNIKNKIVNQKNNLLHCNSSSTANLRTNSKAEFNINLNSQRLRDFLSPRAEVDSSYNYNESAYSTLSNRRNLQTQRPFRQAAKTPRELTRRDQFLKVLQKNTDQKIEGQAKGQLNRQKSISSIKQKTKLCRKPSNRSKKDTTNKKKAEVIQNINSNIGSNINYNSGRQRGDGPVPVKTINVNDMKFR